MLDGSLESVCKEHQLGWLREDIRFPRFRCCASDLARVAMSDYMSNEPAFQVRLDVSARAIKKEQYRGGDEGPLYPRGFRILVRPVEPPIMHNEIAAILDIVGRYNLACSVASSGGSLEVHSPEDVIPG